MYGGGGTAVAQSRLQRGAVAHVALYAGQRLASDALHATQRLGLAVAVVVKYGDRVPCVE